MCIKCNSVDEWEREREWRKREAWCIYIRAHGFSSRGECKGEACCCCCTCALGSKGGGCSAIAAIEAGALHSAAAKRNIHIYIYIARARDTHLNGSLYNPPPPSSLTYTTRRFINRPLRTWMAISGFARARHYAFTAQRSVCFLLQSLAIFAITPPPSFLLYGFRHIHGIYMQRECIMCIHGRATIYSYCTCFGRLLCSVCWC